MYGRVDARDLTSKVLSRSMYYFNNMYKIIGT
jgi:hypothetical protein